MLGLEYVVMVWSWGGSVAGARVKEVCLFGG